MLEKIFDESHYIFMDSITKFILKEITPHVAIWEEEGKVPRELWYKMGEHGFCARGCLRNLEGWALVLSIL